MENQALFLREFFNETLYRVSQPSSKPKGTDNNTQKAKPDSLILSGDKSADVLLLFSYQGKADIPAADRDVAGLMLKAVKLTWPKVAWLNMEGASMLTWESLLQAFGGTRIIIFNMNTAMLPESCEEGKITVIDGRKILCTCTIPELEENKSRKMLLWKGLQEMFGL
jgi:hypothetical protein